LTAGAGFEKIAPQSGRKGIMFSRVLVASAIFLLPWAALGRQATPTKPAGTTASPGSSASAVRPPEKRVASAQLTNLFDAKIHAEWDAIKKKDKKALGDLLDEDYIAVEADREGERYKWKVISELDRTSVTDYTLSFLKVVPLGPDAAFVRYEVFERFPAKSTVRFLKVLVGEIWVRDGGQWKALHYQETPVK
jgi:hypothetical protein